VTDPSTTRNDDDLLAAARRGDRDALEALAERYQPQVYRFGAKMCGDAEDARDIVQDTLLAMARSVGAFRGDSSISTWLYTIARRLCIKKRRKSKFAPTAEESLDALGAMRLEDVADGMRNPEQQAIGRQVQVALDTAIASLDAPQREVLVLRDIEGLTAAEVARVLDVSVEAVKSRLHRARAAVREKVAPVLGAPVAAASQRAGCPDVVTQFSHYLEGELTAEAFAEMEIQLARCPHCRGACESLKRTIAICNSTPAPAIPSSLAESVRDAIRGFLAQQSQ